MSDTYLERMAWEDRVAASDREDRREAALSNPAVRDALLRAVPAVWRDDTRFAALIESKANPNARRSRKRAQRRGEQP